MPAIYVSPLTRLALVMGSIVLITIAVLAFIVEPPRQRARERSAVATAGTRTAVDEFLSYAAGTPGVDVPRFGRDHAYTAEGVRRLAAALDTLPDVKRDDALRTVRDGAERLRRDPTSLDHADVARDVFTTAADVIDAARSGGAQSARTAAAQIDPSRPLLAQQHEVRAFFQVAAAALREHAAASDRHRNIND